VSSRPWASSRLVELDSSNHILRADERAFDSLLHEIREFLGAGRVSERTQARRTEGSPRPLMD
jgi:hypothetical protein